MFETIKFPKIALKTLSATTAALILSVSISACSQQTDAKTASSAVTTSSTPETASATPQTAEHNHETDHGSEMDSVKVKADAKVEYALTPAPNDHVVGSATAPNVMIVYASVTCPHCAHWFNTEWPNFKAANVDTGKVKFIFREFPTQPSQLAVSGFMIANCAGEDKFFDNLLYQFKNQEAYFQRFQDGDGEKAFMEQANYAGLKTQADVEQCFKNDANFQRITDSMDRAEAAGIQGVPGFIINGRVYTGDTSAAELSKVISSSGK